MGAAPTGSGKTLAYALPILQCILEEMEEQKEKEKGDEMKEKELVEQIDPISSNTSSSQTRGLRALIVCPTRELALQVSKEIKTVCKNQITVGTIVGGLAEQKQKRVLKKSVLVSLLQLLGDFGNW